ncbi:RNA-directed DNA polymerase, eukaryota [Tanacetum coccineum]|uniref:RNA-directed DNA polymerase, eukaryota n=1 Tax=Tanacetum coccineum TaxID=301880 RepID=A0ABQ5HVP7_9ASTR
MHPWHPMPIDLLKTLLKNVNIIVGEFIGGVDAVSNREQRGEDQLIELERYVSRDEIRLAVWNCGNNKSPGPDGFTFEFFKKYWDLIGTDFCDAVEFFFSNGFFPKGCNSSFIALIPKVVDAKFVKDFRPISLIGCVYKVVTKILANRLALVISDLVSDTQSAFIAGRQILDGPFILDEILKWCKRKKNKAMFFKVDFAKAYDSVRWDYLIDVLEAFGFGSTWCNWIRGTFSSAKASILVNGSPSKEFSIHRGIQLSESVSISHLFYADDAMFIGEWSEGNLANILKILKCFYLASGLQINIHKSQVLGVGVPRYVVDHAASTIGCSVMNNQFRYLGVKVGESMSRHKAWDDIIHKLTSRLSNWKAKTLSIGGRLTLLKSVLGASPIYSMSIYKVPKGVLKIMEAIHGSLWFRVIRALYGDSINSHSIHVTSNWSSILRELHVLKDKGFDFWSHCKRRIGNGSDTRFWFDCWIGETSFHTLFPRLVALEEEKNISVALKLNSSLDQSFRRCVRDGIESQQMTELKSMLNMVSLSNSRDRWRFDLTGDGEFRVKEVRNFIDDLFLPSFDATRWVKCIPIKINIFVWRARRDCLPTRVNLARRGVYIESNSCPTCRTCEEDIHHSLFQCDLAQSVLHRICRWWDFPPNSWTSFMEWQSWFSSVRLASKVKILLEGVFYVAWWAIWSFRNRLIFQKSKPRRSTLFDDIVFHAYTWCSNRCNRSFSWENWLKNPHLISL